MKDERGDVVYVGKAQSLRNRVRCTGRRRRRRARSTGSGASSTASPSVEYTLTDSVSEALLLEANLIKRYRPRFNVRLKDDKSYPYIKVTLGDDFPRVERTRKLVNDGSRYFGPYASATSVDESMNLVRRLFPFRTCTIDIKDGERALQRPCLLYHIKRCQGPCIQAIAKDAYRADIAQVELFLEGRQETLVKALEGEMASAAERDGLRARRGPARQDPGHRADDGEPEDGRVRADRARPRRPRARRTTRRPSSCSSIRDGKMVGRDVFLLDAAREATDDEVLASFLEQYYARATSIPREVYVPSTVAEDGGPRGVPRRAPRRAGPPPGRPARREARAHGPGDAQRRRDARPRAGPLAGRPGQDPGRARGARRRPRPRRRRRCASSATTSATSRAANRSAAWSSSRTASRARASTAGSGSRRSRGPTTSPATRRSCAAGSGPVEVGEEGSEEERRWAMPDLVIIDGGKGQVSAAKAVLDELGLHDLPLAGLAKEREELFLPGPAGPDRPAGDVAGALPRPAAARRGAPVRDHLPPRPAGQAGGPVGVRRPAGRRPEAQARAAQGLRLDQARARRAGRADRGGAGHRARAGGADQGDAGGLTARRRRPGDVPCTIPPRCVEPVPSSSSSSASLALLDRLLPGPHACRTPRAPRATGVVETKLGLDLEGGLRVEYQAQPVEGKSPTPADMASSRTSSSAA